MKPTPAQRRLLMRLAEGPWKLMTYGWIDSKVYLFLDPPVVSGAQSWENVHTNTWWACEKRGWLQKVKNDWHSTVYTISPQGKAALHAD